MKIKTSELTGGALEYAVAVSKGYQPFTDGISWIIDVGGTYVRVPYYSTDWRQAGPIIERERIELVPNGDEWGAFAGGDEHIPHEGPTPLIAAMRCYVATKLGDEVDVPEELV